MLVPELKLLPSCWAQSSHTNAKTHLRLKIRVRPPRLLKVSRNLERRPRPLPQQLFFFYSGNRSPSRWTSKLYVLSSEPSGPEPASFRSFQLLPVCVRVCTRSTFGRSVFNYSTKAGVAPWCERWDRAPSLGSEQNHKQWGLQRSSRCFFFFLLFLQLSLLHFQKFTVCSLSLFEVLLWFFDLHLHGTNLKMRVDVGNVSIVNLVFSPDGFLSVHQSKLASKEKKMLLSVLEKWK